MELRGLVKETNDEKKAKEKLEKDSEKLQKAKAQQDKLQKAIIKFAADYPTLVADTPFFNSTSSATTTTSSTNSAAASNFRLQGDTADDLFAASAIQSSPTPSGTSVAPVPNSNNKKRAILLQPATTIPRLDEAVYPLVNSILKLPDLHNHYEFMSTIHITKVKDLQVGQIMLIPHIDDSIFPTEIGTCGLLQVCGDSCMGVNVSLVTMFGNVSANEGSFPNVGWFSKSDSNQVVFTMPDLQFYNLPSEIQAILVPQADEDGDTAEPASPFISPYFPTDNNRSLFEPSPPSVPMTNDAHMYVTDGRGSADFLFSHAASQKQREKEFEAAPVIVSFLGNKSKAQELLTIMLDLRHSRMALNYRKNIDRIDSLKSLSFFSIENMHAVLKGNYTSVHPNPAMISSNKTNTAVHFLLALETKANGNVATPQSIPELLQGVHNIKESFVAIYGGRDFYDSLFKPVINTLSDLSDLQYFRNPILKNKIYWFV